MALLEKVTGEPPGQFIELKSERIVIGRSPDCDIILDPNGVSRRHASIHRSGDKYYVVDLDSRNKTKVNSEALVPNQDRLLQPGDRINICDVEFVFHATLPRPRKLDSDIIVTETMEDSTVHTLDASQAHQRTSTVRPETKLQAILDITRNLSSDLNIDTVAPKILDSLWQIFPQAERAFLILKDPETQRLVRKAFKHRPARPIGRPRFPDARPHPDDDEEAPTSISRTIVNHVLVQRQAVISQDASTDQDLPISASIADLKIRSVMCAPLLTPEGQALGILQLDTSDRRQFQQEDLELLLAVASQAAVAVENARLHENQLRAEILDRDLKLAEQVQKSFLPQAVPAIPGYEFFAHYHPAYEVGGDYYDFVPLPNDRIAIALGDVSGKGVSAALMMAKFSGDTRYCILTEGAPAAATDSLNDLLIAAGIEERFITLSLSVLDLTSRQLTLCSAGHLPILVRRASGTVEEIGEEITGFPLGIMPHSQYKQTQIELQPGDVVVVYSDGVTDPRNGNDELYDSKENRRLIKRVAASAGGSVAIGRAILQDIREFSAGQRQSDDITLICFGPVAAKK